jgi:hypothetical protein
MDKKNTGLIATIVAAVICGCPGLIVLCFGAVSAIVSFIPGANIDVMGSNNPQSALTMGLGALCLGIVFVAIPVVVWFVMMRKKSGTEVVSDEPLPPAN